MANAFRCFLGISLLFSFYFLHSFSTSHVYIVYLGHTYNIDPFLTSEYHVQLLTSVFKSKEEAKQSMLYSYKHMFSGFAAMLNASQATVLANTKGVISVFESKILQLHTTRSWDFMGLTLDSSERNPLQLSYGDDIIVGLFDTGVWPESASFMEETDMGPIPKSWKGQCVSGEEFNSEKACNKKLIGARYYPTGFERRYWNISYTAYIPEYRSPRDIFGHGCATASTAVGSRVKNTSLFGFAEGIARGGAPRARLAVYKVCWSIYFDAKCMEEDLLAAFDEALNDGVHVISASLGDMPPLRPFFASSVDIGSFHAMQLGVSVILSAGNQGPDPSLVINGNPWSICVAASSMDRSFPTKILLDDDTSFVGQGLITNKISGLLARAGSYFSDAICNTRTWMNISASGMILVCFATDGQSNSDAAAFAAYKANASAIIFVRPLLTIAPVDVSILPVVQIDTSQGTKLYQQFKSAKVQILPSETAFTRSAAPMVSYYSSRGPSSISPDFLKPDIGAPGTNILAAWLPNKPPSDFSPKYDDRSVEWNFQSGTSMSCPHVSGVVALIKSAHPNWSPAAIRSALMTTAYNTDITGDDILVEGSTKSCDPFDIGSGHMNPVSAFNPGLIYDMTTRDYVFFLCNYGYSDEQIRAMVICRPTTCPSCTNQKPEPDWNINYPSITVSNLNCTTKVKRTVRNVGHTKTATYHVTTVNPNGVSVVVWPKILKFSSLNEEKTYYVILTPLKVSQERDDFGRITWSDGIHHVRSPLVVQVNTSDTNEVEARSSRMAF